MRNAKAIAIEDHSFWQSTLPFSDRLSRIIDAFSIDVRRPFLNSSGTALLTIVSEAALSALPNVALGVDPRNKLIEDLQAKHHLDALDERRVVADAIGVAKSVAELGRKLELTGVPLTEVSLDGCGSIDSASCDAIWARTLIELKLTARTVGIREVRQVLVYSALAQLSGQADVDQGVVVNPRNGVAVVFSLDELLTVTGGLSRREFAEELGAHAFGLGTSG